MDNDFLLDDDDPFNSSLDNLLVDNIDEQPNPNADVAPPSTEPVTGKSRKRCWFITVNNYTDVTIDRIKNIPHGNIIYIGWEIAPTTNMKHIHAQISFKIPVRFVNVDRFIHKGAWNDTDPVVEGPKPNVQYTRDEIAAIKYVKKPNKDGTPKQWKCFRGIANKDYVKGDSNEIGDSTEKPKEQGKRNDLKRIHQQLLATAGDPTALKQIMIDEENHCAIKYHAGIEKVAMHLLPSMVQDNGFKAVEIGGTKFFTPMVTYIYGKSGLGKSCLAWDTYLSNGIAVDQIYPVELVNGFFNGYKGHKYAIWDEFRSSQCPLNVMLKLLQGFPYQMNVKNGTMPRLVQQWIFTSIYPPWTVYEQVFSKENEEPYQWFRRLTQIIELVKVNGEVVQEDRTIWFTQENLPKKLWLTDTSGISDDFIL